MGEMVSQDSQVFNTSGLSGTYTFGFLGVSSGATTEKKKSVVGEFFADGDPGHTGPVKLHPENLTSIAAERSVRSFQILNTSFYSIGTNGRARSHYLPLVRR